MAADFILWLAGQSCQLLIAVIGATVIGWLIADHLTKPRY